MTGVQTCALPIYDAKRAFWVPLSEVRSELMFEDHYAIIQELAVSPT